VLEYIRRLAHRVTSYLRSHRERHDFVEHPQPGQLLRKFRLHCRHVGLRVGIGKVVTGNDPRQEFDQPGTIDGTEKKVAVRFKALSFADPGKGKERGS
jgi:hypothetical protein